MEGERIPEATMDHTNIPNQIIDRFEDLDRELIELLKKLENSENPS